MIPRRLLVYLGVFLALLAAYVGLTWHQNRKEAREKEAKKIFQVKEAEITELTLKGPKEEIRLALKDGEWFLTAPLKMRADRDVVNTVVSTLATMIKERDLESGGDLKAFGLDKPVLVVGFTAQGKSRRLTIGPNTPGELNCYAYQDEDPRHLLVVNTSFKASLDRPLSAFRDKTIFTFAPEKAKSLSFKTPTVSMQLEKQGPGHWRWVGRENFPVRGDRVEELLRFLQGVKVKDFVSDAPKDLAAYGLAPAHGEVAVVQDKEPERLLLGKPVKLDGYARKAPNGPVVLLDKELLGHLTKAMAGLEDRRLWRGQVSEAKKVAWGPPEKTWVGVKEKDFVKVTGPGKQELKHPAVLLEASLWKLQQMEFSRQSPPKSPGAKPIYLLELMDETGKPLFRLEELGPEGDKEVLVRVKVGDKTETGPISRQTFQAWQMELGRLAGPPPEKRAAPGPKSKSEK